MPSTLKYPPDSRSRMTPAGLAPEEIATLSMPLATVVRAVKEVVAIKAGERVLIQSDASGFGSVQIQVARALGARVATTARDDSEGEYPRSMGAKLVLNYLQA